MCRQDLTRDLQTAQLLLHSIRCAMKNLEPSKPWLSDLDVRNRKYKELLQSFKSLVEAYMTLVLDNQRRFSLFFEEQINQISPYVNLERALQSVSPPLPVQILIQRGERTNDQMIQQTMGTVQNVHKDLHVLAATFRSLSEIRNELNILFERYRRRWPLLLKEEGHIYVIDDNLDLVEKISVGVLHEKNYRFLLSNRPIVLWIHDLGSTYNHDAIVNPEIFPNFREGQLLKIHCPPPEQEKDQEIKELSAQQESTEYVIVKGHTPDKESLTKQLQLSISKDLADRFNFRSRQEVYVEFTDPTSVSLDHVELAFKEQYLGRSDMWRLQQSLKGNCAYLEKKILYAGSIKATAKRLFKEGQEITSGYITEHTRIIFRSASAKYFLFIQMSKEMWEFDEDGELYFEKAVSNFLPQLFNSWKEEGTNHVVSIVLFTRVFYESPIEDMLLNEAEDGRHYKDFYKVLADWETNDDWISIIGQLKKEQTNFQQTVLLRSEPDGRQIVSGQLSMAYEGNVLEAINLALNPFDKHFVDRDLMRTGLSIILITPGVGKFFVNKKLLRLTNERMTDNGIAMDLVCLSPLPLHITPLMYYMDAPLALDDNETKKPFISLGNSPEKSAATKALGYIDPLYQDSQDKPTQKYFSVPHWVDCSFYHHETGRFLKQDKFKTRCKMYELQMMGVMEHDIKGISVPYLSEHQRSIKPQKSSSSLNEKLNSSHEDPNGYLSRSANISSSMRRSSFFAGNTEITTAYSRRAYDVYDANLFKSTPEPRFSKKPVTAAKIMKSIHNSKGASDSPDRPESTHEYWKSTNPRHKATTTWHHTGEPRRMPSIISQSIGAKGPLDRKEDSRAQDPSPTFTKEDRFRSIRRGTVNSIDGKFVPISVNAPTERLAEEDETVVISSSTVDPVPIKLRSDLNNRTTTTTKTNHSPRSLPSIHKQSGNSDLMMRTSINRSSPSHTFNRTFKHILINPCNPSDNPNLFTSHLRRWQHALPKVEHSDGPVVHWRSLVTPACLPLTTDYFPSNEELAARYNHYMYTVSASEDTNLYQAGDRNLSEHKKTENLLIEMLSQRLAQGFQIIVDITGSSQSTKPKDSIVPVSALGGGLLSKDKEGRNSSNTATTIATMMTMTGHIKSAQASVSNTGAEQQQAQQQQPQHPQQEDGEKSRWKHMVWWLSMGHQVHQLTFDSSGQNVEVRRYVRMIDFDINKINYKCAIWPKNMPTYRSKTITFSYPSLLYAWNYLDHLVAGYQEELTDNLRFWRARFILIPRESLPTNITFPAALHDHLDDEEKRIALFELWVQNMRKAKWLTPEEREELQKKRKKDISDLGIKLTTMDPSGFISNEAARTNPSTLLESKLHWSTTLTRESKTKDIANAMQDPRGGLKIIDRRWHFKLFHDVFTGSECVDWLIHQIEDITTREQAVQFGNSLMQRKPPLFLSATKRHSFLDGNYFYTIHEEFMMDNHKKKSKSTARKTHHNSESTQDLKQVPSQSSTASNRHVEFKMSQSMIIDVDPYKKSDRRETAILHYDTIHNPKNCYHFQINWLGCTAQLVQELVQNWSRQAERCGLKLVEGSVDQAYEDSENDNPFQCPVPIPMAVPPPSVEELMAASKIEVPFQFYEIALVRHLDFVLDVEADANFVKAQESVDLEYSYIKEAYKYDQYIHRSGVAFVQIRPNNHGFFWVNNRLYTNHTPALSRRQTSAQHPETLRVKFQEHCSDVQWLTEFWETTRAHFLQGVSEHAAWVYENSGTVVETAAEHDWEENNAH
ncbi:hypothetical protein G6F46_003278 [Rhizopus delemar]|uniref:Vacuolar membrane-associated protein IML1 n=2 Tax=Rhizopus TaxID=4842 RepID=A0A9P7CSV4_9FUNG|nr:hypothetical protein G6F55_001653 [Rhizopus delemar]KAG1552573.1 hypothetical protein G6F51_001131 [Rhizopus arrhizus]KAG1501909.1 hypothetical protein G6F54_002717 [Rhizopus delemar]KAG1516269.1 hypothetical protein G6F53_002285 [Rhizopus delemar]KAG1527305.1 hypothetical protein G6F52_001650 [Rhizopus delemar]